MAQQAFFAPDKLKFKAITGTANENLPYKFTYNQRRLTQGLTQLANHPNRDDILRDALRDSLTEDAADQLPAIEASLTAGYTPQELLTAMSAHFQSESYQGSHMQLLTSYPNFQDQSSLKMGDYLNKLLKLAQRAGITTDATLDLHVRSKLGTADSPAYSRWRQTRSENGGTNARVARLIAILQQQDFGSNGTPDLDDASEGENAKTETMKTHLLIANVPRTATAAMANPIAPRLPTAARMRAPNKATMSSATAKCNRATAKGAQWQRPEHKHQGYTVQPTTELVL